jgi:hypothetical protein
MVIGGKISTRPAQYGEIQGSEQVEHVTAKTAFVAEGRPLLEEATVDAPAQVLHETAENAPFKPAERAPRVD